MDGFLYLIPLSLGLGVLGLAVFFWTLRKGQYEDLDGAAERILHDEDAPLAETDDGPGESATAARHGPVPPETRIGGSPKPSSATREPVESRESQQRFRAERTRRDATGLHHTERSDASNSAGSRSAEGRRAGRGPAERT